jgi:hypothetical protein
MQFIIPDSRLDSRHSPPPFFFKPNFNFPLSRRTCREGGGNFPENESPSANKRRLSITFLASHPAQQINTNAFHCAVGPKIETMHAPPLCRAPLNSPCTSFAGECECEYEKEKTKPTAAALPRGSPREAGNYNEPD